MGTQLLSRDTKTAAAPGSDAHATMIYKRMREAEEQRCKLAQVYMNLFQESINSANYTVSEEEIHCQLDRQLHEVTHALRSTWAKAKPKLHSICAKAKMIKKGQGKKNNSKLKDKVATGNSNDQKVLHKTGDTIESKTGKTPVDTQAKPNNNGGKVMGSDKS